MSRHAALIKELASRLARLDVRTVVYFHTDHFEPWRPIGDGPAVGPAIVESIYEFCRATDRVDFARRLTLFYKPHLNYALRKGSDLVRTIPDDLVGFLPRSEYEEKIGREAMREVVTTSAHDIQLHIHHEYYTATTAHTEPVAKAWFSSALGKSLDEQRLELAIRLNREIISRETGRSSARWFFVHGHWALNASDDTSCTIVNEIDVLLRNGCLGDFTFPAGRPHTNPRIKVPYLCKPVAVAKSYDFPAAEPEPACGNAEAARSKFFIWASAASNVQCSLDYMSESTRRHLENTEKAAIDLIDNAYVVDGRLYIKTHAHSLHHYYFEHTRNPVFPHQYPASQALLSVLFDAVSRAGLELQFATAPEVYDMLLSAQTKPEIDLENTYLRPPSRFRARFMSKGRSEEQVKSGNRSKPLKKLSLPSGQIEELVCQQSATILRQRILEMGPRDSGAYEHYSKMLEHGFSIPKADLLALDIVRTQAPRFESYHEIGSGLGILTFLLAFNGYPSVGFECDRRRYDTAVAIWHSLASHSGVDSKSCRLVCERFPAIPQDVDPSCAIAIFTDFLTTQTAEHIKAIFAGLRRYPYALIDLRRFCILRDSAEEQKALLQQLEANGFEPVLNSVDAPDCVFVLLRNQQQPRSDATIWKWRRWLPRRRADDRQTVRG